VNVGVGAIELGDVVLQGGHEARLAPLHVPVLKLDGPFRRRNRRLWRGLGRIILGERQRREKECEHDNERQELLHSPQGIHHDLLVELPACEPTIAICRGI
jgi:hypothetical protein